MKSRRKFIASFGTISTISMAGCIAPLYEENENNNTSNTSNTVEKEQINEFSCEGECKIIKNVYIDSHSGFGSYTDIVVEFEEKLSKIELTIETYNDKELNGVKNINKSTKSTKSTGVMAEFDNFKTNDLNDVNIIIHSFNK